MNLEERVRRLENRMLKFLPTDVKQLTAEIEDLKTENEDLKCDVADLESQVHAAEGKLDDYEFHEQDRNQAAAMLMLEPLLNYARWTGTKLTVEAIEAACNGKPLEHCLHELSMAEHPSPVM